MSSALTPKALRKGTRSCVECRRRKVRCYFDQGNTVCGPCVIRGCRCINQKNTSRAVGQALTPIRTTPPETPELAAGQQSAPFPNPQVESPLDSTPQSDGIDCRVPLVSVLQNAEVLQNHCTEHPAATVSFSGSSNLSGNSTNKAKSICETLRAALPSYDTIILTLEKSGAWWTSYRAKIRAFSGATDTESIEAFAVRAYTSSDPGEVGALAVGFARSARDYDSLYALVEGSVTSDLTYMTTIKGLECLILLAKVHTDIGQPRKAWVLWRQAMTFAQLMGLYQTSARTLYQRSLWWEILLGDRFTSLLVGLPYGFNDAHLDHPVANPPMEAPSSMISLILSGALLAGKVIDRNTSPGTLSFAHAMDLDEQMLKLTKSMPNTWWSLPTKPYGPDLETLKEQIVLQFYFFHITLYIHLPFIGQPSTEPSSHVSKLKSTTAARELLKRYNVFRSEDRGPCIFECRTSDFIAFTAVVVLLICASHAPETAGIVHDVDDTDLIHATRDILKKQEQKGCKIARQCLDTLRFLSSSGDKVVNEAEYRQANGVRIPYFGTIVKRPLQTRITRPPLTAVDTTSMPIETPVEPGASTQPSMASLWTQPFCIEYQSQYAAIPGVQGSILDAGSAYGSDAYPLEDFGILDIDQDWATLLDLPLA